MHLLILFCTYKQCHEDLQTLAWLLGGSFPTFPLPCCARALSHILRKIGIWFSFPWIFSNISFLIWWDEQFCQGNNKWAWNLEIYTNKCGKLLSIKSAQAKEIVSSNDNFFCHFMNIITIKLCENIVLITVCNNSYIYVK